MRKTDIQSADAEVPSSEKSEFDLFRGLSKVVVQTKLADSCEKRNQKEDRLARKSPVGMFTTTYSFHAVRDCAKVYDSCAPYYDAWRWQSIWKELEWPCIEYIAKQYQSVRVRRFEKMRVLDVGCGTGNTLKKVKERFPYTKLCGLDLSQKMITQAAPKLGYFADLRHEAAEDNSFKSNTFDLTMMCRVASNMINFETGLEEAVRTAKPGGLIIIADLHPSHNYTDTRLPTDGGKIVAPTFKRDPRDIERFACSLGLSLRANHVFNSSSLRDLVDKVELPSSIKLNVSNPLFFVIVFEK